MNALQRHGMLAFSVSGSESAEPVILLHGWGSSAGVMASIADALSTEWRVYNVDLPGHGAAPVPTRALDLADHAAEIRGFLRNVVGRPAAVVGHSNGGRIALHMAAEPDATTLFTRLALVGPSGMRRRLTVKVRLKRLLVSVLRAPWLVMPGPIREFGLDWLRHSLVWRMLGSSDYRALEGTMRETFVRMVNAFVEDRLDAVTLPVTVFWGDQDRDIVRDQVDRLVRGLPVARLEVIGQAGHYAFLDRPDSFMPALRAFLAEGRP